MTAYFREPTFKYLVNSTNHKETMIELKSHLVGELALGQSEGSPQILFQSLALLVSLDGGQNLSVNLNLILLPLLRRLVSLLLGVEDVSLLLGRLLGLNPGEVFVIDGGGDLDSRHIDLGGGGEEESLVHSSQRSPIQLERSSDEDKTGLQALEDNDPLALVNSSQEDGDGASGEAGPDGPLVLRKEVNGGAGGGGVLGGVVSCQLLHSHHPGVTILGSTDLLLDKDGGLSDLLSDSRLLCELVDGLLVVGGAPAEPVHAALKSVVPGLPRVLVLSHYFSCRSESSNISLVVAVEFAVLQNHFPVLSLRQNNPFPK